MNSQQLPNSYNINSKHYSDKIENDIVNLTKCLSIEYQIDIESAKEMARVIVQRKLNGIINNTALSEIKNICKTTTDIIKSNKKDKYYSDVYELLKLMELL